MKTLTLVAVSLLAFSVTEAQPALAPSVSSVLLGVPMPSGTTLNRSRLYRFVARTSLQLEAKKRNLSLGEPLEVFKVPMDAPWQADVVAVLQGAGWSVQPDAADPQLVVSEKAGAAFLLEFVASPRDRYLYINAVMPRGSAPVGGALIAGATPPVAVQPAPADFPTQPTMPTQPTPAELPTQPTMPTLPMPAPAGNAVAPAEHPSGSGGFEFTTTNFTDGWVTTDEADYVKSVKGPITAYLFRRVLMTAQMRDPVINTEDYFWQRDVVPRYEVPSIDRSRVGDWSWRVTYLEGDATERATGRHVYVGMYVDLASGGALNILVVAPSKAEYLEAYPTPKSQESALGVNRFAVGTSDVVGAWSASGATGVDMFYTATGGYAGSNSTSSSDSFTLNADGTYTSKHAGVSERVNGAMRVFQSGYSGRWSMNGPWELTLTNRYQGASDTFAVHFESVQGGRVLHLQNVQASGIQYHLGKVR